MVEETFVDVVCYEVVVELGVDEGDPVVFAEGGREHAFLGGGKLFERGFSLDVSNLEAGMENSDDSPGGEEDLVGVDIAVEPHAVRLEWDLESRHRQQGRWSSSLMSDDNCYKKISNPTVSQGAESSDT